MVSPKSLALVPVIPIRLMLNVPLPVFFKMTDFETLIWLEYNKKVRLVGEKLTEGEGVAFGEVSAAMGSAVGALLAISVSFGAEVVSMSAKVKRW